MKISNQTLLSFTFSLLFSLQLYGQSNTYKKLKIYGSTDQLKSLAMQGVCMDHGDRKNNAWFSSYFNPKEITIIEKSGLKYDVEVENAKANYSKQRKESAASKMAVSAGCPDVNEPVYPVPSHFKYGSMGNFYTLAQLLSDLDSMALLFPNLITFKQPIDTALTWEGNAIYYVKISDNPTLDEGEPEVYYSALHHAREPLSMQQLVYYMWYLLENYQTDSLVKNLVNERELYFVPCVNPDGYLFNELTDPQGGGFWRKNRRDNLDGTYGVDLNRNYDIYWGFDDVGSSPNSFSDVYRGPTPASEPEIQMVTRFINSRQFVTALDFHTYGNHLLYPWSHIPDFYTPDSALYVNLAETYTEFNDYSFGTCNQALNYIANGGSSDWLYGEQTSKPKIMDFTPECGYDFWPNPSDILQIVQSAIHMDVMSALVAGKYAKLTDESPKIIAATSGYITFKLNQLGIDTNASYTVTLTPISPQITGTGNPKAYSNLNFQQVVNDSIAFTLSGQFINGTPLLFLLTLDMGNFQLSDTLVKYYGTPTIHITESGNNMSNWALGTAWGTTTSEFHSPPSSITDSPIGNYQSSDFNVLVTSAPVNLIAASRAGLSFYTRWLVESRMDYVEVQASDNGGNTWTPLCGKYTHPGSVWQDFGNPLYEGIKPNWVKEEIDLGNYTGKNILIRFVLVSDQDGEFDGYFIDDLTVWSLNSNVGIPEQNEKYYLSEVYPNPSKQGAQVNYTLPENGLFFIEITNALGKVLLKEKLPSSSGTVTLNTLNFGAGVYQCTLTDGHRTFATKKLGIIK